MKKLLEKMFFILRMAYKNIIHFKFQSIILLLIFTILFILTLLSFSTKSVLTEYFYHQKETVYQDIDFYLTYDENSNARYFSIRDLKNNLDMEATFKYIAPFFNMSVIMQSENQSLDYVDVMASSLDDLKKVSKVSADVHTIQASEIIISQTISEQFNVVRGDTVYLQFGDNPVPFKVKDIVVENGLFRKNNIFIDKESNMVHFLESLDLNINPIFTKNIYNHVYFSLKNDIDSEEVKHQIKEISYYQKFILNDTIDSVKINNAVSNIGSVLYLLYVFVGFAVLLVLQSTMKILFEGKKSQIGVMSILGGRKLFSFIVLMVESIIFLIISYLTAIFITDKVINHGLNYMDSKMVYSLSVHHLVNAFFIIFILIIVMTIYHYLRIKNTTLVDLTKNHYSYKRTTQRISYTMILVAIIIAFLFNTFYLKMKIPIQYYSLIHVCLSLIFLFVFAKWLIQCIHYLDIKFRKKSTLFSLFSLKNISHSKIKHHILSMMLISFLLIILLIATNGFVSNRLNNAKESIKVDYAITNIINHFDATYESLKNDDALLSLDKVYLYKNVEVKELDASFTYAISLDEQRINQYINMKLDDEVLIKLKDKKTPYILLPIKFHYLNDLEIGDSITLKLNEVYNHESFIIAGFTHLEVNQFIITNINHLTKYQALSPNTLFLDYKEQQQIRKKDLIKDYGQGLYYIIDFDEMVNNQIEDGLEISAYVSYLIVIIIICFMLTIFNNTALDYIKMKPLYSRIRVLGCSYKKLIYTIIIEKLLIPFITMISILSILKVLSNNMTNLFIFFGTYYEEFHFQIDSILIGFILGTMMYLISSVYYLKKVKSLAITKILRNY